MKNRKLGCAILIIAFVLFNIIAFAIPTDKTSTFWIAYAFTDIAFIAQIFIWKTGFKNAETMKSKFLGLPILHLGIVCLIIQVIAFAAFMAIPTLAPWIAIVACALILGISLICMITSEVGKEEIKRVEAKVQTKTMFIKTIQSDIELIANSEKDANVKDALYKLAEKVRYSDPMSDASIVAIEENIIGKVAELKTSSDKATVIDEISTSLTERNNKCKIFK